VVVAVVVMMMIMITVLMVMLMTMPVLTPPQVQYSHFIVLRVLDVCTTPDERRKITRAFTGHGTTC
jgi:hypothetical protein